MRGQHVAAVLVCAASLLAPTAAASPALVAAPAVSSVERVSPAPAAAAPATPAAAATPAPVAAGTVAPSAAPAKLPTRHVVRPHDTIRSVAARYHLAWRDLADWNELPAPYRLHAEGVLRLDPPTAPLAAFTSTITMPALADTHWQPGCPVAFSALREVWVTYLDFQGVSHEGYVVVHRTIAAKVQTIFRTLYDDRYRIRVMAPLAVNGPQFADESPATLAYFCRAMRTGSGYSQHAYGTAIDVNPEQNPEITSTGQLFPETTSDIYRARAPYRMGIIHRGGTVVRVFASAGLKWGGNWHSPKDYMHFSVTGR